VLLRMANPSAENKKIRLMMKSLHAYKIYQTDLKVSCPSNKITGNSTKPDRFIGCNEFKLEGKIRNNNGFDEK